MRTYIIKSEDYKLGYALKVVDDEGNETITELTEVVDGYFKLPTNPANRQWHKPRETLTYPLELQYKETRHLGSRKTGTTTETKRTGWWDYLTEEERKTMEAIKAKAKKRAEVEELRKAYEETKKRYEEALAAQTTENTEEEGE